MQRWRHRSLRHAFGTASVLLGLVSGALFAQPVREPPAPVQQAPGDQIESTPLPLTSKAAQDRLRQREELRLYERDLQAWCAQTSPQRLEGCMRDSLARHGLAPTFFTDMERALERPPQEESPQPRQAAPSAPLSQPRPFWPPPPSLAPPPFPPPPGPQAPPPTARPGPVQEWPTSPAQVCAALGQAAELIARARDAGEPLDSILQRVRRQSLDDPVVDEWREEMGADIYASPELIPERARQAAEAKCVRQMQVGKQ